MRKYGRILTTFASSVSAKMAVHTILNIAAILFPFGLLSRSTPFSRPNGHRKNIRLLVITHESGSTILQSFTGAGALGHSRHRAAPLHLVFRSKAITSHT